VLFLAEDNQPSARAEIEFIFCLNVLKGLLIATVFYLALGFSNED
jgi:hypothetical protein